MSLTVWIKMKWGFIKAGKNREKLFKFNSKKCSYPVQDLMETETL